jgi:hypothetical protein
MNDHWDIDRWLGDRKYLTIPLNETQTIVPDLVMIKSWLVLNGYGSALIIKSYALEKLALEFYYTCGSVGLPVLYKKYSPI